MEAKIPDIRFRCPHCREVIKQPFEMLGQLIDCPACGETIEVQKPRKDLAPAPPLQRPMPKLKIPKPIPKPGNPPKGRLYKVLTPADKWFEGAYHPDKLEEALNHYAVRGWHVVSVVAADPRQDILVVMRKAKSGKSLSGAPGRT